MSSTRPAGTTTALQLGSRSTRSWYPMTKAKSAA